MSDDARPGSTIGPKEGVRNASSGSVEDIVESDYITFLFSFHIIIISYYLAISCNWYLLLTH